MIRSREHTWCSQNTQTSLDLQDTTVSQDDLHASSSTTSALPSISRTARKRSLSPLTATSSPRKVPRGEIPRSRGQSSQQRTSSIVMEPTSSSSPTSSGSSTTSDNNTTIRQRRITTSGNTALRRDINVRRNTVRNQQRVSGKSKFNMVNFIMKLRARRTQTKSTSSFAISKRTRSKADRCTIDWIDLNELFRFSGTKNIQELREKITKLVKLRETENLKLSKEISNQLNDLEANVKENTQQGLRLSYDALKPLLNKTLENNLIVDSLRLKITELERSKSEVQDKLEKSDETLLHLRCGSRKMSKVNEEIRLENKQLRSQLKQLKSLNTEASNKQIEELGAKLNKSIEENYQLNLKYQEYVQLEEQSLKIVNKYNTLSNELNLKIKKLTGNNNKTDDAKILELEREIVILKSDIEKHKETFKIEKETVMKKHYEEAESSKLEILRLTETITQQETNKNRYIQEQLTGTKKLVDQILTSTKAYVNLENEKEHLIQDHQREKKELNCKILKITKKFKNSETQKKRLIQEHRIQTEQKNIEQHRKIELLHQEHQMETKELNCKILKITENLNISETKRESLMQEHKLDKERMIQEHEHDKHRLIQEQQSKLDELKANIVEMTEEKIRGMKTEKELLVKDNENKVEELKTEILKTSDDGRILLNELIKLNEQLKTDLYNLTNHQCKFEQQDATDSKTCLELIESINNSMLEIGKYMNEFIKNNKNEVRKLRSDNELNESQVSKLQSQLERTEQALNKSKLFYEAAFNRKLAKEKEKFEVQLCQEKAKLVKTSQYLQHQFNMAKKQYTMSKPEFSFRLKELYEDKLKLQTKFE